MYIVLTACILGKGQVTKYLLAFFGYVPCLLQLLKGKSQHNYNYRISLVMYLVYYNYSRASHNIIITIGFLWLCTLFTTTTQGQVTT